MTFRGIKYEPTFHDHSELAIESTVFSGRTFRLCDGMGCRKAKQRAVIHHCALRVSCISQLAVALAARPAVHIPLALLTNLQPVAVFLFLHPPK
mgnify:CR=1 FL=1